MSSSPSCQTYVVGYHYSLGMHMVLSHQIDALLGINSGDHALWRGEITANTQIHVDHPELHGGEGGVVGYLDVEFGGSNQEQNDYLQEHLGVDIPAFRGVTGVVLRQMYLGDSTHPKHFSFLERRTNIGWLSHLANINGDMNPAHIIYDCLTNSQWGLGYLSSDIGDSFSASAQTLYDEGFGLSFLWNSSIEIQAFIQQALDHIDGVLYTDIITGKFELKLLRHDYEVGNLPVLNPSNVSEISKYTKRTAAEIANVVVLKYKERQENQDADASVTVSNPAVVQRLGRMVSHMVNMPGIAIAELANSVAMRELRKISSELTSVTLAVPHSVGRGFRLGDVFALTWPDYGVAQEVFRILDIAYGEVGKGEVRIEAMQDVFATGESVFAPPAPSQWQPMVSAPTPTPHQRIVEATYWDLVHKLGEGSAVWNDIDSAEGKVLGLFAKPTNDAIRYQLYTRPGAGTYASKGYHSFTPTATVANDLSHTATTIQLSDPIGLFSVSSGFYAHIGDELAKIETVNPVTNTITVSRGVLDTVPSAHNAGARVWFSGQFRGFDPEWYTTGVMVQARATPVTLSGELDLGLAPTSQVVLGRRMFRPYAPGKFQLNGEYYPESITGELSVSWAHRDRLQQTAYLVTQSEGDIGPEDGTTYTVRIYGETGALRRTYSGEVGTSKVYPLATEISDSGLGRLNKTLRVTVEALRDGYGSWQQQDYTLAERYVTITYDGNGNTGGTAPATSSHLVDALAEIAAPGDLEKTGHVFSMWNTDPGGGGTSYAPLDTFNIGNMTTLYAIWQAE